MGGMVTQNSFFPQGPLWTRVGKLPAILFNPTFATGPVEAKRINVNKFKREIVLWALMVAEDLFSSQINNFHPTYICSTQRDRFCFDVGMGTWGFFRGA